jgi:glutamate-ammonia-ligase adenylyltransferase
LLDGLIDATALEPQPEMPARRPFARGEAGEDYQGLLDRVRADGRANGASRSACRLICGALDPLEVGGAMAASPRRPCACWRGRVAEFERMRTAACRVANSSSSALGRFGGGTLTHASDLDLVYLFTGDFLAESDGRQALGATHYFNRLASRVSAAMSVPTASGPLYDDRHAPAPVRHARAARRLARQFRTL